MRINNNPLVYQPFDPNGKTGNEISFLFGPHSGGNHAKAIIEKYGYRCDEKEKATIAQFIKEYYTDRRKGITDQEVLTGIIASRLKRLIKHILPTIFSKDTNYVGQKYCRKNLGCARVQCKNLEHPVIFAIDFTLLHEVTSAQAFQILSKKMDLRCIILQQCLATIDYSIPTRKNRHEIFDSGSQKTSGVVT